MKISKIIMGALAGLAVILSVRAEEDIADKIREECEESNKTYWVESDSVCIPRNPCAAEDKYARYCEDLFDDIQVSGKYEYMFLVDLHRTLRGLDCEVQPTKAKPSGQDYVACVGEDVMVYEFDDIEDKQQDRTVDLHLALERVVVNTIDDADIVLDGGDYYILNESACETIRETAAKYGVSVSVGGASDKGSCRIVSITETAAEAW